MFPVQALCSNNEAARGMRLLLKLHARGVGLNEAIASLEPLARAWWQLREDDVDGDGDGCPGARICTDPTVRITPQDEGTDGDLYCVTLLVERAGCFKLTLWTHWDEWAGEFVPFDDQAPTVAFEAEDVDGLARFLLLARMIGDDLEAVPTADGDRDLSGSERLPC